MNVEKTDVNQASGQERQSIRKLEEVKKNGLGLLALDYDGTIFDRHTSPPYNNHQTAINLALEIMKSEISLGLITSRDASIKRVLFPPLLEASREIANLPVFVGAANGSNLTEIKNGRKREIYSYGLTLAQIRAIVDIYNKIWLGYKCHPELVSGSKNLNPQSQKVIKRFLTEDWSEYIADEIFAISKKNLGVWAEESKVSLVLPGDKDEQEKIIAALRKKVGDELTVAWANDPFAHISKKLDSDGKLLAVQTMMKELAIDESRLATFGDTPHGNDAGLLSFPYSFTNYFELKKEKPQTPPYILPRSESPVEAVYQAVHFLIN